MKPAVWTRIADFTGFSLSNAQLDLLGRYRDWLREEAIPAGGVGPGEKDRLELRHIGDSLLFAQPVRRAPSLMADLGTGVGLPGIPLAIMWPGTEVILVDRSQRRADLARRACRVLDLANVEVVVSDIDEMSGQYPLLVSRATLPARRLAEHVRKLLSPGGMAVVGGSWTKEPRVVGWEIREISAEMLDRAVWLLIMRDE